MDSVLPDFRALFESAPGLYLVLSPDFRIVAVSEAYLRATMTTREAILDRGIFEVFPDNPDDPAATGVANLRASLESVRRNARTDTMAVQKYDVRRPDGSGFEERYWSPQNSPVPGPRGEVRYIIHRVEDVTEFIRLKEAGREREELTRTLQDRAVQMESEIYLRAREVADASRQLKIANAVLGRLYHQISLLMSDAHELNLRPVREDDWDLLQNPISPEEVLARIGKVLTDHKRIEEQLRQAQKMEAVGRLAGGVAHDFNNLLTVIAGYASMLKDDRVGEQPELEEIQTAVKRAADLTRQLLAFSRKQALLPRVIDVNTVVSGMEGMLRRLIGENVTLVTALAGDLGRVKADPGQLEQVIMNLAVNARDAMPQGGKLIIETRAVTLAGGQAPPLGPGRYTCLSVSDTGHGMSSEIAGRVFEPFFTTKEVGKGTGLGLATAFGIAQQSGGTLTVDSTPGAGTIFRCYLPLTTEEPEEERNGRPSESRGSKKATVLLVEDETALRKLLVQVLTAGGHHVLEAANGEEALALTARHGRAIDLLLTDVVMPGISGPQLVAKLTRTRPQLSVLYMSGYDRDLIDRKSLESTAGFLPKPFSPRALLGRVDEMLGVGGEGARESAQFGS